MKDFIVGVLATAAIIVACSCVGTAWEPMRKTGGSGTQAVGESDLVLPGGGEEVAAAAQELPVYDMEGENGMTDAEKLALIKRIVSSSIENFWDEEDTEIWKGVVSCIDDVLTFGGGAVG